MADQPGDTGTGAGNGNGAAQTGGGSGAGSGDGNQSTVPYPRFQEVVGEKNAFKSQAETLKAENETLKVKLAEAEKTQTGKTGEGDGQGDKGAEALLQHPLVKGLIEKVETLSQTIANQAVQTATQTKLTGIEAVAREVGALDPSIVAKLLNEKVELVNGVLTGAREAVDALKVSSPFLFGNPTRVSGGGMGPGTALSTMTQDQAKTRYDELVKAGKLGEAAAFIENYRQATKTAKPAATEKATDTAASGAST